MAERPRATVVRWPLVCAMSSPAATLGWLGSCLERGRVGERVELGCELRGLRLELVLAWDEKRGGGADRHDCRADVKSWRDAVHECSACLVAAVVGEDRGQYGNTEDAAELSDRVVGAGCLALFFGLDR